MGATDSRVIVKYFERSQHSHGGLGKYALFAVDPTEYAHTGLSVDLLRCLGLPHELTSCARSIVPKCPLSHEPGDDNSGGTGAVAGTIEEGSGGLTWLKQVALSGKSSSPAAVACPGDLTAGAIPAKAVPARATFSTQVAAGATSSGGGLDWLTAATADGQAKPKPRRASLKPGRKASITAISAGGWLTSGKLGVSTEDDSDRDVGDASGSGSRGKTGASTTKKEKKNVAAVSTAAAVASAPGGWLASGTLGIPADDESDQNVDSVGGDGENGRRTMVSGETQTEDNIEAIVKRGLEPKLPPWAKRWTPPPEPEVVPNAAPEQSSVGGGDSQKEVTYAKEDRRSGKIV